MSPPTSLDDIDFEKQLTKEWWQTRKGLSDEEKPKQDLPKGYKAVGGCLCDTPHRHRPPATFRLEKNISGNLKIISHKDKFEIREIPQEANTGQFTLYARNHNVYLISKGLSDLKM